MGGGDERKLGLVSEVWGVKGDRGVCGGDCDSRGVIAVGEGEGVGEGVTKAGTVERFAKGSSSSRKPGGGESRADGTGVIFRGQALLDTVWSYDWLAMD